MTHLQEVKIFRKKNKGVTRQYFSNSFRNFLSAHRDFAFNRFKYDPPVCFPANAALMYFNSGFPFSMSHPSFDKQIKLCIIKGATFKFFG